jgi:hypothetical protein
MTRRSLVICTAAAFVACGVGLLIDPRAMLASYLTAWFALSAIPIGALGVLFTTYLVRGGWTQDLHAPLSRATLLNPIAALLFIPVLAGLSVIYPWAEGAADLPPFKSAYLAPLFFALRSVGYFALWTVLAVYARRAYGDRARMERAAAIGLILWAITVSFAGIDWLESIEPKFHSSIYGLLVLSFTLVSAFAFGLAAVLVPARPRRMANSAYAGLLLSVLLLWAYLHAMQYIIVWAGNIPDEVSWYAVRSQGAWSIALCVLFLGQFIVPFFALLSARVRASTRAVMAMAAVTLALRYLEASVLILPPLDLGAGAVVGCLSAAIVATASAFLLAWRGIGQILDRAARSATARGERQPADAAGEEPNGDYRGAGEHA